MRCGAAADDGASRRRGCARAQRASPSGNPFGLLVVRDLQSGLDALPPEQREVVLLVALEGMSYAEVALLQGVPIGTVMSRSRGARAIETTHGGRPPGGQHSRGEELR